MSLSRRMRTVLVPVAIAVAALAVTVGLLMRHYDRGPTAEELRVYGVFLSRWAADRQLKRNDFALAPRTLQLEDPHYDKWVPAELRTDKTWPPPDFVGFCGEQCARDFVRKNLAVWQLRASVKVDFVLSAVEPETLQPNVVVVTRIGFNPWHTRAVLSFEGNCSDASSEIPSVCLELGEAYLLRENGVWKVDRYTSVSL